MILDPGQTQCFYNLEAISFNYLVFDITRTGANNAQKSKGQINVERCKSKTFVVK